MLLAVFVFDREENMGELAVKEVEFNGNILRAAQDANNVIWVGVSWICEGLGLGRDRTKYERTRIQKDLLLSKGVKFYPLGNDNANSNVLCLMIDFLPLWLAKISITPKMKIETPELVERLIEYQLKAKDVLAEAFLVKQNIAPSVSNVVQLHIPNIPDYTEEFKEINQKVDRLYDDVGTFVKMMIDWKEKSENTKSIATKEKYTCREKTYTWKQNMYGKMDEIYACGNWKDKAEIMQYIYRYMNRVYGVVWDQEIKEYKERNGLSATPATIDVIYDNESYRSIFESILFDLCENSCENSSEKRIDTVDDIIQPLIEKYGDNSHAGMVTWRKVYDRISKKYHPCWKNLQTRYLNQYGDSKVTKKQLIVTRPSLHKKFVSVVKEMLNEEIENESHI